jgi:hypothetical protein
MNKQARIKSFAELGKILSNQPKGLEEAIHKASALNPWFTPCNCAMAVRNIAICMLEEQMLTKWAGQHAEPTTQKTIGIVAAGNIPLVSFHDILCVLMSGHRLQLKLSEKDNTLISYILEILLKVSPDIHGCVLITDRLKDFDAIIATGSNNTARYFEYYFGKYPHIIRRNRTSLAILSGNETDAELIALGHDIFDYFGLGCRNVSHLLVPAGYDFGNLLKALQQFEYVADHNKYRNNFDYQRTNYLMSNTPYLPVDYVNIVEREQLFSPVSSLHYHHYSTADEIITYIEQHREHLQCIVGKEAPATVEFGKTQQPGLSDYADDIDTMQFLATLS